MELVKWLVNSAAGRQYFAFKPNETDADRNMVPLGRLSVFGVQ